MDSEISSLAEQIMRGMGPTKPNGTPPIPVAQGKQLDISNIEVPDALFESIMSKSFNKGSKANEVVAVLEEEELSEIEALRAEINELRQEVIAITDRLNEEEGCGTTTGHIGTGNTSTPEPKKKEKKKKIFGGGNLLRHLERR